MKKSVEEVANKEYVFKTLVKADHKFGDNEFVLGRITGFMELLANGSRNIGVGLAYGLIHRTKDGCVLYTKCTPDQYVEFTKLVNKRYPELCIFNYGVEHN